MKKVLPIIIAVFLTVVLTWPLLPNITSFYSDQGDYPLNGAVLWYNYDSIATGRIFSPKDYWQGFQFYPHPYSLIFANNPVAAEIFFAPIYFLTNNLPLAVNTYAMLTLVLSFLAAFYTIRYFLSRFTPGESKSPGVVLLAALVGAFIFAFNQQTFARFPQHIDILGRYFLPLVFLFTYKFFSKPTLKDGFLLGLFFSLNALTHTYYPLFALILLPLVAMVFLISHLKRRDFGYLGKLGKYGLIGLVFLPVLLYFNLPLLEFSQKEGAHRSIENVPYFSARITDWFAPSPDNLIYKGWVEGLDKYREPRDPITGVFNYEEHTLYLGLIPAVLFFLGLKSFQKSKSDGSGKWFFYILLILPFILTFGPYFSGSEEGFPLPFYWLYKLLPLMEAVRSPTRFEFVMLIPFALIASFGTLWLLKKVKVRGIWIIGVIGMLLILENFTLKNFDDRSESLAVIRRIGVENLLFLEGSGVLHLPIYTTEYSDSFGSNSGYINWATRTKEKIVNGNASYLPPDYLGLQFAIKQGLDETVVGILKALDVRYLIYHKKALTSTEKLIDSGVVLDNPDVRIVDLSNLKTNISVCNTIDLDIRPTEGIEDLIITNRGNCYLISPKDKRYQQVSLDFNGNTKKIFYRLPLVINPQEQIILSKVNREFRVE